MIHREQSLGLPRIEDSVSSSVLLSCPKGNEKPCITNPPIGVRQLIVHLYPTARKYKDERCIQVGGDVRRVMWLRWTAVCATHHDDDLT